MDSILNTIKKKLGLDADYDAFDEDIIVSINTAFFKLRQLGVGPKKGFRITSNEETWDNFIENEEMVEAVKDYIYFDVKQTFDPPTSSFVMDSLKAKAEELEWRLNVLAEGGEASGW